jgi:hypothetical protein
LENGEIGSYFNRKSILLDHLLTQESILNYKKAGPLSTPHFATIMNAHIR